MSVSQSEKITLVPFEEKYSQAFKALNQWWIEKYFTMEAADHKALDNPQSYIIANGGYIAIALLDNKPVGACALIKMKHPKFDFELSKMGVSENSHGKGIGFLLGSSILKKAKELGAQTVFLETHSTLKPAISLYKKLGFTRITGIETPYERSNYQMQIHL